MWGDRGGRPHLPTTPRHYPISISHHIDEDALEGLYFAFSHILRCLPYFLLKTRPTTSYELLEAFSSSCGEFGASVVRAEQSAQSRAHLGAWKPESRSIYHTRAGNPISGWGSPGRRFSSISPRQSLSSPPHPQPALSSPPPSPPEHPHPSAHTHAPTHPHPRTHTQRKKS